MAYSDIEGCGSIVSLTKTPENHELLSLRILLQAQTDKWHRMRGVRTDLDVSDAVVHGKGYLLARRPISTAYHQAHLRLPSNWF
jgi:hypothetical protein